MTNSNITVYYVVGGDDQHYKNMLASINSLVDLGYSGKFLIWEIGEKLDQEQIQKKYDITNEIRVCHRPNEIDFSKPGKKGYLFWRQKYKAALEIETECAAYVDTDTLFVNNSLPSIAQALKGKIAATTHFWVPTIKHFEVMAVPKQNLEAFLKVKEDLGLNDKHYLLTGGCFIFETTEDNNEIFKKVLKIYDQVYTSDDEYMQGITDEIFFSHVVQSENKAVLVSGAINHCFMGDANMPLVFEEGNFWGKNSYEKEFAKVMLLHCDTSRRDPSAEYSGRIKDEINKILKKYSHILK